MMEAKIMPFLETIYHLRTIEQVILYNKLMVITAEEEKETISFLEAEYEKETLEYPSIAPEFDSEPALWAAKIVYFSAQLLLYRDHKTSETATILPAYKGMINASALLSADICLRFLPQILMEMKRIDASDEVIQVLESHLRQFHYSAIGFDIPIETPHLAMVFSSDCLQQLYLNRIVERKAVQLAEIPEIKQQLAIGFGDYKWVFWKTL